MVFFKGWKPQRWGKPPKKKMKDFINWKAYGPGNSSSSAKKTKSQEGNGESWASIQVTPQNPQKAQKLTAPGTSVTGDGELEVLSQGHLGGSVN